MTVYVTYPPPIIVQSKYMNQSHDHVYIYCTSISRLRSIKKRISEQEASVTEKKKSRKEDEKNSVFETKRLGKYMYPVLLIVCIQMYMTIHVGFPRM